jgi:tetratricopeptide (TPR) repeat protein
MSRASLLKELGREQEALADLDRAIELDPDYARLYARRSEIYTQLRQFDNAIADGERAIQLNDEFPDAHWALAGAYHDMGDTEKCDAIVEKLASVSLRWQDKRARVRALVRLAWARARQEDVDGALSAWDQAIENAWGIATASRRPAIGWNRWSQGSSTGGPLSRSTSARLANVSNPRFRPAPP